MKQKRAEKKVDFQIIQIFLIIKKEIDLEYRIIINMGDANYYNLVNFRGGMLHVFLL